ILLLRWRVDDIAGKGVFEPADARRGWLTGLLPGLGLGHQAGLLDVLLRVVVELVAAARAADREAAALVGQGQGGRAAGHDALGALGDRRAGGEGFALLGQADFDRWA